MLTAVSLDKQKIITATFRDRNKAKIWLDKYGDDRNLYFHVNPVLQDLDKKASRKDIASLAWLHVDIDPRAGEDIKSERERALGLLEEPPGNVPPPSAIVFSGGGYQGFWRLREPLPINGEEGLYEEAKRYNQQLEIIFGADNCHNVDRIMRLPGTINRPDAKKKKKGRKPALAEVVIQSSERLYNLSEFSPANPVQLAGPAFAPSLRGVEITGNVDRVLDINDLPEGVSDLCKVVIVQGIDPDDPNKFESRSEALFFVCCEMVRGKCDDNLIYSVITDPDFNISSSILEKGSNAEKYATRQIGRAKEEAISPHLREMNEKHAVISDLGGKCRVISEIQDHSIKRSKVSAQSFEDVRNRYLHIQVRIGVDKNDNPVFIPLGKWWLTHPDRMQYETMAFAPGRELPNTYNLWRGFAFNACPGDCSLYLSHLLNNICKGNEDHFNYLTGWMATAVQQPDSPGHTAVVMRGKQGTGKGIFAKGFGALFGRHFLQLSDPKHLVGSFNAHLRDCSILFGDEAFYAGDKKHESILKTLITEETLAIEKKGIDVEISANYTHLILASNSDWVIPAGAQERRFFVLDVSDDEMQNTDYFEAILKQLDNGGYEALLYMLMHHPLDDFNVRKVPQTLALMEQKMYSMQVEEEWWFGKLQDGKLLMEHEHWQETIIVEELITDFIFHSSRHGVSRRSSAGVIKRFLQKACNGRLGKVQSAQPYTLDLGHCQKVLKRPYSFVLPSLQFCRDVWDKEFGGPFRWDDEAGVYEMPDRLKTRAYEPKPEEPEDEPYEPF